MPPPGSPPILLMVLALRTLVSNKSLAKVGEARASATRSVSTCLLLAAVATLACGESPASIEVDADIEGGLEPVSFGNDLLDQSDTPGEVCDVAQAPARLRPGPIDIVVVVDNSGSMGEELQAVEANINDNFASILETGQGDYRVILLSRHRENPFATPGPDSTSICVTSPLSSLASCPAAEPGLSERFFHYSASIGSNDALDRILQTYAAPDTTYGLTDTGWSRWLRQESKKVFLLLSDDDAAMQAEAFIEQLHRLAPLQFGADPGGPGFVFHSIVGIREKQGAWDAYAPDEPRTALRCRSDSARVLNPGLEYQRLSRLTGGLRFPICQVELYDTVFDHIARDVLRRSGVHCRFPIPEPPANRVLELDHVEVDYLLPTMTEPSTLRQAPTRADCGADAFLVEQGAIALCPEACSAINAAGDEPEVSVRFTCERSVVLR